MSNLTIVKKAYEDFSQGNIPAVLGVFDDNIKWMGASGFPFHNGGDGIVVGPQQILEQIFAKIPAFFTVLEIDVQKIYESGNTVIVEAYFKGTWKATGNSFQANGVTIWDLQDGKVVPTFEAVDTGAIMI